MVVTVLSRTERPPWWHPGPEEGAMDTPTTIVLTVSRQFASGGSFIGQAVAQRLGMRYTDRDVLVRAAAESGCRESDLEASEERAGGFWSRFFRQCALGAPEAPFVAPLPPTLEEGDLFELERRIIQEVAARSDAVIVGRGGFHILADHPGLVSVRVHARRDWRIRRAMAIYGIEDEQSAADLIRRSDEQRARFVRAFTGRDWDDALAHHLCLDTSAIGVELATELVVRLVAGRMEARRVLTSA
jgi:cytidylate kinase